MIRNVIFDLDGTLIDSLNLYLKALMRTLKEKGCEEISVDEVASLRLNSEPRLMAHFFPDEDTELSHRHFLDHYRMLHTRYFEGVYPGVSEMLASLRSRHIRMGIVSGKSKGAWEITRQHVQLGDFDTTIFDDEVGSPKPDCEGILKAMNNLGASPTDTVYVGDSKDDLKAAKAAGIGFLAALWSKSESELETFEQALTEIGPYAGAFHPAEIERLL